MSLSPHAATFVPPHVEDSIFALMSLESSFVGLVSPVCSRGRKKRGAQRFGMGRTTWDATVMTKEKSTAIIVGSQIRNTDVVAVNRSFIALQPVKRQCGGFTRKRVKGDQRNDKKKKVEGGIFFNPKP
jgi:hypothetical protein